jgi:hypothetical protein
MAKQNAKTSNTSKANSEDSATKVITGLVRFSYAHVFEPSSVAEGGDKKYSVALLIPKKDKASVAKINAAIEAAKQAGKADKFSGKFPANLKMPLRDGDEERGDNEEYVGHYFINATSKTKPQVVDADLQVIIDPEDFYSGCYGRASINFYAFNSNGNKGIACGLNNLQKLKDGEKLSGRASAEDDFSDAEDIDLSTDDEIADDEEFM